MTMYVRGSPSVFRKTGHMLNVIRGFLLVSARLTSKEISPLDNIQILVAFTCKLVDLKTYKH